MKECKWVQEDYEYSIYSTDCGKYFQITEGTPEENHFRYCCYCGGTVMQLLWQPAEDEADDD